MKEIIHKLREEAKNKNVVWRSCWLCNPAHDYLKKVDYLIECFECGHYYYKGIDITMTLKEERLEKLQKLKG